MHIITNSPHFPIRWTDSAGRSGTSSAATTPAEFLSEAAQQTASSPVLLVNCQPETTLALAAHFTATPWRRRSLVSLDLVLRRPQTTSARLLLPLKRFLFSQVDLHLHYFRDLVGFNEVFGIGPHNSAFIPFKSNLTDRHVLEPQPDGNYILCFGRSMRDYDTFFDAVETLPFPAAIPQPDPVLLARHGACFSRRLDQLPVNVQILEDDGTDQAQIRILSGARMVVLPILPSSIVASGISTCLNAMVLGKCVVGSTGPGMSDLFTNEVLLAPPQNPAVLATVIRRAWEDDELRAKTASAGWQYATSLGGEQDLYRRIIDSLSDWTARGR